MNAPAKIARPWDWASGVLECQVCEGQGSYSNGRGLGGNDPDSWDIECDDCEATGHTNCAVCGYDVLVKGYDCLPCFVAGEIPAAMLATFDGKALGKAICKAMDVARAAAVRELAS